MKFKKSKKGENNLMLSETAMLIIVATILIIMLVILVRMYLIFEDPDVIASKQAYNRVFTAIESLKKDGDITYEYASLRKNNGILILNSETLTRSPLPVYLPFTNSQEDIDFLPEYKKDLPKICYVYTHLKEGKRIIKINECKRISTNLELNYLLELATSPTIAIKKDSNLLQIISLQTGYDPKAIYSILGLLKAQSFRIGEKLKSSNQLIDLEAEKWFSEASESNGEIIIAKEGQYFLKGKSGSVEHTLANTGVDIATFLVISNLKILDPLENFENIFDEEDEYKDFTGLTKLCLLDNIGRLDPQSITIHKRKMIENEYTYENIINRLLTVEEFRTNPTNSLCLKKEGTCSEYTASINEGTDAHLFFKKLYLYKMEKSGITIGFFILSDVDLTTENFKILLGNVNFQNKVKELVCGEGNVEDCDIF